MPTLNTETAAVRGLLALELRPGHAPAQAALSQAAAGALAALIGHDVAQVAPAAERLELVLGAAHFDPAEALRPGWPLHRRLLELWQRAPRVHDGAARVIAFGSDVHGHVPPPLQAEADLHGGALRVLPFVLPGDAAAVAAVQEAFETELLDRGMASAQTALAAQQGFAAPIEHARYLTVLDLAAMTALQYRHQGLEPLWPLLETALLRPQMAADLDAPPEPLLRYRDGVALLWLPSPDRWQARCAAHETDRERLARGYAMHEMRLRQFAAVLRAHGVECVFDGSGGE